MYWALDLNSKFLIPITTYMHIATMHGVHLWYCKLWQIDQKSEIIVKNVKYPQHKVAYIKELENFSLSRVFSSIIILFTRTISLLLPLPFICMQHNLVQSIPCLFCWNVRPSILNKWTRSHINYLHKKLFFGICQHLNLFIRAPLWKVFVPRTIREKSPGSGDVRTDWQDKLSLKTLRF